MGIDPALFGEKGWRNIHWFAKQLDTRLLKKSIDESKANAFIVLFGKMVPCPHCRKHFGEMINNPFYARKKNQSFSDWVIDLHNAVNKRLGKPVVSYEKAYTLQQPNLDPTVFWDYLYLVGFNSFDNPNTPTSQEQLDVRSYIYYVGYLFCIPSQIMLWDSVNIKTNSRAALCQSILEISNKLNRTSTSLNELNDTVNAKLAMKTNQLGTELFIACLMITLLVYARVMWVLSQYRQRDILPKLPASTLLLLRS